ncbi:MAG TPA: hypothetical protein VFQ44_07720 [Streptosporangiaceae bacterium]|nr:hypothetical protein [Streptosporangiaceae bacterium]
MKTGIWAKCLSRRLAEVSADSVVERLAGEGPVPFHGDRTPEHLAAENRALSASAD